jgi:hypothetical protein
MMPTTQERRKTFAGNPMSDETAATYRELERKGQAGASERTLRPLRIAYHLHCLMDDGILSRATAGMRENGRWVIDAPGFRGVRYYSHDEAEAFIHGVDAARGL